MRKIANIKNLSFNYKQKEKLFSDISLELKSGKIYALLGDAGEGKSTFLKLLAGLLFPSSGTIKMNNINLSERRIRTLSNIFYLSENTIYSDLNPEMYEKTYAPFFDNFSSGKFYKYMNEFSIDPKDLIIEESTPLQKKKILLSFGLATNATMILLDEPFKDMDKSSIEQLNHIMLSIKEDDRCVMIASNEISNIKPITDHLIILNEHKIIINDEISEIAEHFTFRYTSEKLNDDNILFSQPTANGYSYICKRNEKYTSEPDTDLLFSALMTSKEEILSYLTNN